MALSDKFNGTQFFIEVFTINQGFTFDQMKDILPKGKSHMDIGTPSQKYAKKIFFQYLDFASSVDILEEIPIFFSIPKIPSYYLKQGMSEIQYYKYHMENHYIKISSIIDFSAHFVNDVCRLGIPARKCNVFSVTENLNIVDTQVAETLKKFQSHFKDLKRKRNIIIHQGRDVNEEIKSLNETIFPKSIVEKQKNLIKWFHEKREKETKNILKMLDDNNNAVCDFLIELCDNLREPFLYNHNYLKSIDKA